MVARWTGEKNEAVLNVAEFQASLLKKAQQLNDKKAGLVQWAVGSEVAGVGLLALAVAVALLT